MKEKYSPTFLELVAFESADIITTSTPSSTPSWDSDGNVDTGGWT